MRTPKAIKARALQPVLTWTARRNRCARELAAAMQMSCAACGVSLAAHVGAGNRWKGCRP